MHVEATVLDNQPPINVSIADGADTQVQDDVIRSRDKSDSWHELYNTPLPKDCPASPAIFKLLHRATRAIDVVAEAKVKSVLAQKKIHDFDDHFFYNKEWWYKRVRMPFKSGSESRDGILKILQLMKTDPVFAKYLTEDVETHFINWARRCISGRYEQLPGIEIYKHDGHDSNGLDLWLRESGTHAENFHQKLIVGTGPFGMGVESAHYYHVLLSYFYLINASIRRGCQPNFGHWSLYVEDRIQSMIQQIWGVTVFPQRVNVSEFNPVDFVAVGIGPLSFDPDYVKRSDEPSPVLAGGLKFMAKQMKVEFPPLPISTPAEFSMLKEFCSKHPQPKSEDINQLCRECLQKSNGIDIFPKLPSLIRPGIKRWEVNQSIELFELLTEEGFNKLFSELRKEVSLDVNPTKRTGRSMSTTTTVNAASASASIPSVANTTINPEQRPTRVHVGPTPTMGQREYIQMWSSTNPCKWYPLCQCKISECGGYEKRLCKVYGTDGTKLPPTKDAFDSLVRVEGYADKARTHSCAWYPVCTKKAWQCGGYHRKKCSIYGKDAPRAGEAPSDDELKRLKRVRKREDMAADRAKKRHSSAF